MKTTKKFFGTFLLAFLFVFSFSGCKKDECAQWKEGEDCEIETRSHFYGTYVGTVTANGSSSNASTKISASGSDLSKLNFDDDYYGVLTSANSFDIPLQNLYQDGNTYQIEGNGSLSGSQLSYNLMFSYNGANTVVNFTGTK